MSKLAGKQSIGAQPFLYPEPCLLVSSYDGGGKPNVMLVAWGGVCGSNPPAVMVAVRPSRLSHGSILERGAFTVGIATESMLVAADFTGLASGRDYDKFATAGLTPVRSELVDAPYVAESPLSLECRLMEHKTIGQHTLMIGEILDIKADAACLGPDGKPDMLKIAPLTYGGGTDTYYGIGKRLGTAFSDGKALLRKKA